MGNGKRGDDDKGMKGREKDMKDEGGEREGEGGG